MQSSNIPSKFPIPFGNSAGSGYIRPVPTASQIGIQGGAASLTDGFPPLAFNPVAAGGIPPWGQDLNGLLNQLSAWSRWAAAGGPVSYDSTFSANIGGYPQGTVLSSATLGGFWLSTIDNNTSDPDTGGANWISLFAGVAPGRLLNIQYFSNVGTFTYTPTTGTNAVIVDVAGGGGAGGGCPALSGSQSAAAGGGAGGGWARKRILSGFSGVTVTVGGGGIAVVGGAGGNGGTSSFGTAVSASGGGGAPLTLAQTTGTATTYGGGASPGIGSGGDLNRQGGYGMAGMTNALGVLSGFGGPSGAGLPGAVPVSSSSVGMAAVNPGSGGSGGALVSGGGPAAGGYGYAGLVVVYEYS